MSKLTPPPPPLETRTSMMQRHSMIQKVCLASYLHTSNPATLIKRSDAFCGFLSAALTVLGKTYKRNHKAQCYLLCRLSFTST